jgi:hypothetical protein
MVVLLVVLHGMILGEKRVDSYATGGLQGKAEGVWVPRYIKLEVFGICQLNLALQILLLNLCKIATVLFF